MVSQFNGRLSASVVGVQFQHLDVSTVQHITKLATVQHASLSCSADKRLQHGFSGSQLLSLGLADQQGEKPKPNRNRSFSPKTEPKLTKNDKSKTVTTLI